jgi:hypothetical protein
MASPNAAEISSDDSASTEEGTPDIGKNPNTDLKID